MPLDVRERILPGVGRRYELDLPDEESIAVVVHHEGRRELYRRAGADADYERWVRLSDSQARMLGLFLVGAYYQPVPSTLEIESGSGLYIEWYEVDDELVLSGRGLAESGIESVNSVVVLGVERDGVVRSRIPDEFEFEQGDRVIVIGSPDAHRTVQTTYGPRSSAN